MGIENALRVAVEHHQSGRLVEAERGYREVLGQQPDHPRALELLGVVAHQCGQHAAAVQLIQRAISIAPSNAAAYVNLAEAHRAMRRADLAVAACQRALQIAPLPQAHYNLGLALNDLRRLDAAMEAYGCAIKLDPRHARARNALAMVLLECRQVPQALEHLRAAIAIEPNFADAWTNFSTALNAADRVDEAVDAARRAVELEPTSADHLNNLGDTLRMQGSVDEAVAVLRRAVELDPASPAIHSNLLYSLLFQPGGRRRPFSRSIAHGTRDTRRSFRLAPLTVMIETRTARCASATFRRICGSILLVDASCRSCGITIASGITRRFMPMSQQWTTIPSGCAMPDPGGRIRSV